MKRKTIAGMTGILAGACLMAGCAKTPESSLVKQKGKAAMDHYKEAETEPSDSTHGQTEHTADSLRTRLEAPETWQKEITDETGKLKIVTDAAVEIPEVDRVSTISVSQHPFSQDVIDQITATFFPDATIYDYFSYTQMTKADWQKRLEELKGYKAQGNLDPYHYGTDENGNYIFNLEESIAAAQQNLENAPAERKLQEVTPQFGLAIDYGDGNPVPNEDSFYGIVEMPDKSRYSYQLKRYGSFPMEVKIGRIPDDGQISGGGSWYWSESIPEGTDVPSEAEMQDAIGITQEEARQLAEEKIAQLGIEDMALAGWDYSLQYYESGTGQSDEEIGYSRKRQTGAGYLLHYTRKLNGIPITYTDSYGGGLENMDSEMETWGYERLDLTVSKNGMEKVELLNEYDIGAVQTENVSLLPFSEIMTIYEKMMLVMNADVMSIETARTYNIDRIVFGYGRIYEPASDPTTGLLVPVWNFFGGFTYTTMEDGQEEKYTNERDGQTYLTINAVDGSVIDTELGY